MGLESVHEVSIRGALVHALLIFKANRILKKDQEKQSLEAGADEQELATPILSLCHGIFTN